MKSGNRKGFTLVEILIAAGILLLVTGGVMTFFISSLRSMNFTTNRIGLNRDLRFLTQRLMKEGRSAGQFILYTGYAAADRTAVPSGGSGNYVVFLKMDSDGINVVRSIGYYRDTNNAVRCYEQDEPGTSTKPTLPAEGASASHRLVLEFAKDYTDLSDRLFLNLSGSGLVVYGQIRNDGRKTYKESDPTNPAISTYNFTITPRG
ncbi:MAG: prepilin-type N-terminal cleavage/methylation domain-containing protein [Opitutaceae bacterium]